MSTTRTQDRSRREEAVDLFIDCFVIWRESAGAVRASYALWSRSEEPVSRVAAFAAFNRAVDREERAAELYSALAEYTSKVLTDEDADTGGAATAVASSFHTPS